MQGPTSPLKASDKKPAAYGTTTAEPNGEFSIVIKSDFEPSVAVKSSEDYTTYLEERVFKLSETVQALVGVILGMSILLVFDIFGIALYCAVSGGCICCGCKVVRGGLSKNMYLVTPIVVLGILSFAAKNLVFVLAVNGIFGLMKTAKEETQGTDPSILSASEVVLVSYLGIILFLGVWVVYIRLALALWQLRSTVRRLGEFVVEQQGSKSAPATKIVPLGEALVQIDYQLSRAAPGHGAVGGGSKFESSVRTEVKKRTFDGLPPTSRGLPRPSTRRCAPSSAADPSTRPSAYTTS